MTSYRDLPPVEPVEIPKRFSMTLLARDDTCPRSAYLALKHKNGAQSHAMNRGTLLHAVLERAMRTLIEEEASSFLEPEVRRRFRNADDDTLVTVEPAPGEVASIMAQFVDRVLLESPGLVVPRAEVDDVRESAYHWATCYDVDPATVVGLEQLMVLDLDCGVTVSGRLDLAAFPSPELGQVDDYKSGRALPSQDEYERSLQPWMYAVLLCYGVPVTREDCADCGGEGRWEHIFDDGTAIDLTPRAIECASCDGKGYVERRGEVFGKHLRGVLTREVYPHPKPRDDGLLHHREMLLSRTAIADFRADLETKAIRLRERFESWKFPAVSSGGSENGSWCSRCPAPQECPLPETLRDFAGTVNTLDEATEAWTLAQHEKARIAAIEREVKNFCKAHDVALVVGDQVWRWEPREGRALKRAGRGSDWAGLEAAVEEAVQFGTPFDVNKWVVPTVSNGFVKSKVTEEGSG